MWSNALRFLTLSAVLLISGSPTFAATCSPIDTEASVLASPDMTDIHPDWSDGSTVGLSWSLDIRGDRQGSDGEWYIFGDLIDPKGSVVNSGVYVSAMEWECDSDE